MSKYNKIVDISYWISSILNLINLIIVLNHIFLLQFNNLPLEFSIYGIIITIIVIITFYLKLIREIKEKVRIKEKEKSYYEKMKRQIKYSILALILTLFLVPLIIFILNNWC